jgi:hypothetical protein
LKILEEASLHDDETKAYRALEGVDGIVQCLGSWAIKNAPRDDNTDPEELECSNKHKPQYHLLLEWGEYDLAEFFEYYPPPSTGEAILKFWTALYNIVPALSKIHYLEVPEGHGKATYYG